MRSPSSRVLINRADLYIAPRGRDRDGGATFTAPSTPTYLQVPCSIQAQGYGEVIDDQQRISQVIEYKIIFDTLYQLTPRDQIRYTDAAGATHTLFFESLRDNAGRGSAFTFRATERI